MGGKNSIFHDGIVLYNNKDYNGALTFFLSLPDDADLDNIELAYYIGLCYARLGRYDDALLYLEQVVTAGSVGEDGSESAGTGRVLQCRYILSIIYVMSDRRKLATFELNKLIEAGFKLSSVYASLAYISWLDGDVESSISNYKKSIEIDSDNATALNGLGYVLSSENRDLSTALSYCKKALSIEPNSAACMDSLGFVYMKLGLMNDAFKYLKQAKELMPDNAEIAEHLQIAQDVMGTI
ncbi:MAG: tetratricopeptide repeat protein [Treponema sp.]|mgnify:CR=1 FL=1|nr:tetratricopeptide repeat protein [Treponema sp.]MBR1614811.1 tetratricopeptide repeat protein [Treponema sp.]MBR1715872.1 tetratricopeptide repeat protein [Treponema sp.]